MEKPEVVNVAGMVSYVESNPGYTSVPEEIYQECLRVANSFHYTGVLVIRDPRVNENDNWKFIDLLERYYNRASSQYYNGLVIPEVKPEYHYQVGSTPEKVEQARNHCEKVRLLSDDAKPLTECPPEKDEKWRYFWRIGDFPEGQSTYEFPNVSPDDFPEWEETMNTWGRLMLSSIETVVRMFEIAIGLAPGHIVEMMRAAPHLLAPTGSDVGKYGIGTVFAGYHYDLNFITIHGKSKYPGLSIWLRNGKKVSVKIEDGCLLLQAGIMFEKLTGGYIMAGFHEVVYTEATASAVQKAKEENKILWRVSSTLFGHLRYNVVIEPLEILQDKMGMSLEEARIKYPPMTAGEVVVEELKQINLW
jgi:hypothetical protein